MRILMMIHRLADNSPYCFYVHEQAKALREQGHDVTVISCVGTIPMMKRLRPALAQTDKRTPKADVIDVRWPKRTSGRRKRTSSTAFPCIFRAA